MTVLKKRSGKPYRVLVVDDDQDILDLIKITLERWEDMDIEVFTSTDPESGLGLLKFGKFDMILSDHRMAGMTGVELLSYVKEKYPNIIRVLITAYSELELARDAINRAKVDLYIEKPWTRDQMRADIKKVLEEVNSKREVDSPTSAGTQGSTGESEEVELEDGKAYLFKEKHPKVFYRKGLERIKTSGEGLIISRMHPNKAVEVFETESLNVNIYWLTKMNEEKAINPANLEIIADMIIRYYEKDGKTVILDGIESLINDNSFKRLHGFIDNIVDIASMKEGVFLTGFDPGVLPERELATIENKMKTFSF